MKSKYFPASVYAKLLMLATMFCLAGCSPTMTIPTGETSEEELWRNVARQICEAAWKPQTYSSRDTEQTQLEARANNAARAEFCST